MTLRRLAIAAMIAMFAVQPAISAPRRAAVRDWTTFATIAPGGGFVLGNPRAATRLTEYASFTCSHCAAFAAEGWPALMPYVHSGKLALEVRSAVRDRFDIVATMLARCHGPAPFFAVSKDIFAGQADWLTKAANWEAGGGDASIATLQPADALVALARAAGFDAMLAGRGYTPAALRACFADTTLQPPIEAMRKEAWEQRKISGTPAFLIDDLAVDVHDWAALKPLLDDAVK